MKMEKDYLQGNSNTERTPVIKERYILCVNKGLICLLIQNRQCKGRTQQDGNGESLMKAYYIHEMCFWGTSAHLSTE